MTHADFWGSWERFSGELSARGWRTRPSESLIVPYFRPEFNRCVEHLALNAALEGKVPDGIPSGWQQIAVACRANDMRKVDSGRHATLFEMLVWVGFESLENRTLSVNQLTTDVLCFLTKSLGLEASRISASFFGGGEVMPGVCLDVDAQWRESWRNLGLTDEQLHEIPGPKNYLLFVGEGERCGAKCELFYRVRTSTGERSIEIGTLIVDDSRLAQSADGIWRIEPGSSIVTGAALGVERLFAVVEGQTALTSISMFRPLFAALEQHIDARTLSFFEGDVRVLVDQAKACAFVLCDPGMRAGTPQSDLLAVMARRIRRKLAILNILNWEKLVSNLENQLIAIYSNRHTQLRQLPGRLVELVAKVPWPEGWNPESYYPVRNANE